jgi:N6-L-threonylcarbamoyladenine synthase
MLMMTIESSCDETSAAICDGGRRILSNAVASQISVHNKYGGVVPELASRNHIVDIHAVIEEALEGAGVGLGDLDGFGVTSGPGLVGSLLVGVETAKGLAWCCDRPCVGLNHLEGHLTAILLEGQGHEESISFPYLGVIVSGGHTDLYVVRALGEYTLLGRTRDDAAGEAFDKVSKMLGLGYPGGQVIDDLGGRGDPTAIAFPRPMWTRKNFDFSFSGLKTAVRNHLEVSGLPEGSDLHDVCASFQEAVVDVLVFKACSAAAAYNLDTIVFSGGVACNSRLRTVAVSEGVKRGLRVAFTATHLCTDNAAMLGPICAHYLQGRSGFDAYELGAHSSLALGETKRVVRRPHR